MSDGSKIEWTDATWNVVIGCKKVSPGCDHCYAIRTAHRFQEHPNPKVAAAYAGTEADGDWTGRVNMVEDRLSLPLQWKKPRRIFVNAQSDLFHADVTNEFIARVWAVMALAPQHTFQILTKRHGRMRSLLSSDRFEDLFAEALYSTEHPRGDEPAEPVGSAPGPLPNVWIGVSVEDQARADLRIPALLDTPAAVRWLSCEPLLGPVDLGMGSDGQFLPLEALTAIHWVHRNFAFVVLAVLGATAWLALASTSASSWMGAYSPRRTAFLISMPMRCSRASAARSCARSSPPISDPIRPAACSRSRAQ